MSKESDHDAQGDTGNEACLLDRIKDVDHVSGNENENETTGRVDGGKSPVPLI